LPPRAQEVRVKYFEKLAGDRIYLSPVDADDHGSFYEWYNDSETASLIGTIAKSYSVEEEKEMVAGLAKNENAFAIMERQRDRMIGFCSFFDISAADRTAELGMLIGEKGSRDKGYGTEVLRLMLDHGFGALELNNIMLRTFAFNERAIHLYRKHGFREIGRRRQSYHCGNNYHDEVFMDMLREDYLAKH
jgi:RimJ/RimL family protein N-acetyltransferase